jgi:hypothetical protein
MAWTTPVTANSGEVLTAARYNVEVVANSVMGNPVYTNEAARDAAITAPSEGMRVYLTTPTVPAATGATTFLPTGITTIYNGTSWVCVTPVGAYTGTQGTTTSGSFTATLTSGGTNPSVTLTTGATAMVSIAMAAYNNNGQLNVMGVAVSGATTIAATLDAAVQHATPLVGGVATELTLSNRLIISGLTAGTNTFTLQYYVGGNTMFASRRRIIVEGIA